MAHVWCQGNIGQCTINGNFYGLEVNTTFQNVYMICNGSTSECWYDCGSVATCLAYHSSLHCEAYKSCMIKCTDNCNGFTVINGTFTTHAPTNAPIQTLFPTTHVPTKGQSATSSQSHIMEILSVGCVLLVICLVIIGCIVWKRCLLKEDRDLAQNLMGNPKNRIIDWDSGDGHNRKTEPIDMTSSGY